MERRGGGDGGFSPRATVEDIQRRLLRPPTPSISNHSQSRNPSRFEADSPRLHRNREGETASKKRKLEDYLDPILLSAVSSKIIGRSQKIHERTMKREAARDFEWPVDELKMLMEDPAIGTVNLGNEFDNLTENDEDGVDEFSTPFQKFEETALVLFEL